MLAGFGSVDVAFESLTTATDCSSSTYGCSVFVSSLSTVAKRSARDFLLNSRNLNTPSTIYVITANIPLIYIPKKKEEKNSQINKIWLGKWPWE